MGLSPAPFYVDCFSEYAAENVHADYYGHACDLPFRDNSLDYVLTSHVLEHVANPVKALAEWYRVLRPDGIIYLLLPDQRYTWDHKRPLTPLSHFLDDFVKGTTQSDATHIEDFVSGADWSMFSPATPESEIPASQAFLSAGMHHSVREGRDINIHFHTFQPSNVLELLTALRHSKLTRFKWEVVDHAERFPESNPIGFLAVVRVHKRGWDRLLAGRIGRGGKRESVLKSSAIRFDEWAKKLSPVPETNVVGCVDTPPNGTAIDAERFMIQGWVFTLRGSKIVGVEVWVKDRLVEKTATFYPRPDVNAVYVLPSDMKLGFDVYIRRDMVDKNAELTIYARLQDESITPIGLCQLGIAGK